jgi:hypothetical protein
VQLNFIPMGTAGFQVRVLQRRLRRPHTVHVRSAWQRVWCVRRPPPLTPCPCARAR